MFKIDCLSRTFSFDEAEQLVEEYEQTNEPYIPMYSEFDIETQCSFDLSHSVAILSGARNHGHSSLAQKLLEKIKEKCSNQDDGILRAASILVANTYALSGDDEKSFDIKEKLDRSNKKRVVGVSWTEVNGEIAVSFEFLII